jgi:hypothetical protein
MSRLGALRDGPSSALVVPVPGAEALAPGSAGLPAHVTVLYPFLGTRRIGENTVTALAETFAACAPFDFALTAVARFPGVLYLAPEPAAAFVALTGACVARWPEHPPYAGAYAEVVPHVTLAEGPEPAGLAERASAALPIAGHAGVVWLMVPGRGGRWRLRAELPLAG